MDWFLYDRNVRHERVKSNILQAKIWLSSRLLQYLKAIACWCCRTQHENCFLKMVRTFGSAIKTHVKHLRWSFLWNLLTESWMHPLLLLLTLSWRRFPSYRNQSIGLHLSSTFTRWVPAFFKENVVVNKIWYIWQIWSCFCKSWLTYGHSKHGKYSLSTNPKSEH